MTTSTALTVESDMTARGLRAQLERVAQMDDAELQQACDDAANGYMLYTVKPLDENANRTPLADAIRAERARLYRELWLATWDEGMRR